MLSKVSRVLARRALPSTASASVAFKPVTALARAVALARASGVRAMATAAAAPAKKADMFCFQCEQTSEQKGCSTVGVCGKTPNTAALQDLLMELSKGISGYARKARDLGAAYTDREVDRFVMESLFSSMTNVNFDSARFVQYCRQAVAMRDRAYNLYLRAANETKVPEAKRLPSPSKAPATSALGLQLAADEAGMIKQAENVGVLAHKAQFGPDVLGLKELAMYGLKGTCAYAEHASVLGKEDPAIFQTVHEILDDIANVTDVPALLGAAMKVGALNYTVMGLLEKTHTDRYGHPVPTPVPTVPVPGPCVLVSGHDMHDIETLLQQCDKDAAANPNAPRVNVYTHGEMLPAHSYPNLKKYKSLAGHYGGPWQLQKMEFGAFPGPIVMTSNCIIEPTKKYKDRIFTRRVVGWPGVKHLTGDDFSSVIASAKKNGGFTAEDCAEYKTGPLMTGFGQKTVLSVADKVIAGVQAGAIKHFFVIGGCDGSEGERNYFRDLGKATPSDTVILTLGCGKYRINNLNLGNIGNSGIPRVLDMGQCNDAYGAIQVAVALANAFKTDVNGLPLSFALSWFEQKAVAVLLTLLHLGVKNIRIGPHLPGFLTPTLAQVLTEKFNLMKCDSGNVNADLAKMMKKN